jgi:hypothetical protein
MGGMQGQAAGLHTYIQHSRKKCKILRIKEQHEMKLTGKGEKESQVQEQN